MEIEVKVRTRPTTIVLTKRRQVRLSEIGQIIGPSLGEVYGYLGSRLVRPDEPPFVIYHGVPGPDDEPFEIEICAPIGRAIDPPSGWQLAELPAGTFASTVHVGPYDTLGHAYDEFHAWLSSQGYAEAGPPREVYLSEPSTPPALVRTVIEYPIEPTPSLATTGR